MFLFAVIVPRTWLVLGVTQSDITWHPQQHHEVTDGGEEANVGTRVLMGLLCAPSPSPGVEVLLVLLSPSRRVETVKFL